MVVISVGEWIAAGSGNDAIASQDGMVTGATSKLTRLFRKHRVKKLTLTITVTRPGAIGVAGTLKLTKGKVTRTSVQCLAPRGTSPVTC